MARARLFGQRRDGDADAGTRCVPAPREQDRGRHRREHEDLEVRGLAVLWCEGNERKHAEQPGDPSRTPPVAPPGLDREHQSGQCDREHRDEAHGPQRRRAEHAERGGIHIRHEWWLAVGGFLVEVAALADHLGLGRQERLIGVEDVDEERRETQEERERQQHEEQLAEVVPSPDARGRRGGL